MRDRKDSGLPWVGDIPVDWNVYRGKNVVKKLKRPVKDTDGVITCFRDGEVTLRSNRREEGFTFSEQEVGYQGIEPGDLVIHGMDGFAGSIGISDSRGKGTPVLNVLDSKNDKRFLMYYFRTIAKCGYFESVATGIRVRTCDTNWNKISATPCLVPPLAEQSRIAAFLDDRCAKIDEAIERHDTLIKKLDEYRKAVITKAVTKGVKKASQLKHSDIEWIDFVPDTWPLAKIKHVFIESKERSKDGTGMPLSLAKNTGVIPTNEKSNKTLVSTSYVDAKVVHPGEVVFNRFKARLFAVSRYDGLVSPDYAVYKGVGDNYMPYFVYLFGTQIYRDAFDNKASGIGDGYSRLYTDELFSMPVYLPSREEQQEIVAFLDKKCAAIDAAKERHAQLMAKLEEYKKSLIYNAVTGKIEC